MPLTREGRWHGVTFLGLGLCLSLYYFSASVWMAIIGGLMFTALATWRLFPALAWVVLTIPFYRFPKAFAPTSLGLSTLLGRTASLEFSLTEFTVLACLVAWVVGRGLGIADGQSRKTPPWRLLKEVPHGEAVLTFLAVATISLFISQYLKYSLREYRVVILEPIVFYILLTNVRQPRERMYLAQVFIFLGAMVAIFSLYHYFFIGMVEATGGVRRLLAVYHSPNALALFLGRFLAFCWPFVLLPPSRSCQRWLYLLAFGLGLAALYLTYSRGAWLAVGVAVCFVVTLVGSRRLLLAAAGAGVLLSAALAFLLPWGRLLSQATSARRLYVWQAAWNMIRDHPLFGVGLDNFLYHYPNYMLKEAWPEPNISHPHNVLLDFWTRLGILGVLAMVWLQTIFWRNGVHLYRRLAPGGERTLVLALMAGMLEGLVHGLIDNSFFLIDLAMIFWLFFALMALLQRFSAHAPLERQPGYG